MITKRNSPGSVAKDTPYFFIFEVPHQRKIFSEGCSDVTKKKSKFVTKEFLFALEKKKTYTSMMAPPGALFLSFSRFLRAFFSTGLESAYFPCVCRFASRFADGISKILSFFSLSFSLARRMEIYSTFLFSVGHCFYSQRFGIADV